MKKSGLADSPFFAPQVKTGATPLSLTDAEVPVKEDNSNMQQQSSTTVKPENTMPDVQNNKNQDQKRSNERTLERPNERSTERTIKLKREKIRHTFDIYKDQLIELQRIQWERVQAGKKKPKLGKMVAEGIDLYIKQEASKRKRA